MKNGLILLLFTLTIISCEKEVEQNIETSEAKTVFTESRSNKSTNLDFYSEVDFFSRTFNTVKRGQEEPISENLEFNAFFDGVIDELDELRESNNASYAVWDFALSYPQENLFYKQFSITTSNDAYIPVSSDGFDSKVKVCHSLDYVKKFLSDELDINDGCCNFKIEEGLASVTITSTPC